MKKFICYWPELNKTELHTILYFTDDLGFDEEDRKNISELKLHQYWLSSNIVVYCVEIDYE